MFGPKTLEEAKAYRYCRWGGNPKGTPYDPKKCMCDVADGGRSCLTHQCNRNNGHGPDGLYCHQHAKKNFPNFNQGEKHE